MATEAAVSRLQYLSLVSKVAQELDNHLGIGDKTLAEFVIDMAVGNGSAGEGRAKRHEEFTARLHAAGASEVSAALGERIFNLIRKLSSAAHDAGSLASASAGNFDSNIRNSNLPGKQVERPGLAVMDSRYC